MGRIISIQTESSIKEATLEETSLREEVDKMRWSYSRLSCYEHCKYAFYLKYIIDDDSQYLAEGNFYAEVGSFVHEILAMIFSGKLSIEEAPQYYIDHYDEEVCYKVKQSTMDKTYESCANYFANADFERLKKYEILGVELELQLTIDGYDFICFIDLLLRDKETGKIILIDHKSSAYPLKKDGTVLAKSKESFASYKKQMYLYCRAVKEKFGEFPGVIAWNHFKDDKIASITFDKEEYEESIKWFIDTIHAIEKEECFSDSQDFFYCSTLCDYRNCCEYRKYYSKEGA